MVKRLGDIRVQLAYSSGSLVRLTQLRWRRNAKGLTISQLADLAGMSRKEISYIERGKREPWPATIVRLAKALECETTDLMEPQP